VEKEEIRIESKTDKEFEEIVKEQQVRLDAKKNKEKQGTQQGR
jgi:hypothetical protein